MFPPSPEFRKEYEKYCFLSLTKCVEGNQASTSIQEITKSLGETEEFEEELRELSEVVVGLSCLINNNLSWCKGLNNGTRNQGRERSDKNDDSMGAENEGGTILNVKIVVKYECKFGIYLKSKSFQSI